MSSKNKTAGVELEPPPAELRAALMPAVPVIVDAAIAAIASHDTAAGRFEHALVRNLRLGLTDAVDRWFDAAPAPTSDVDLHFALGRAHARAGRSLDELMGFYRIAAQTMWRRLTEVGSERGIDPRDLYGLAETGFGCVEEISTHAAAGFADEQSHRSGASYTRRNELMRLLLADPPTDAAALRAAAHAAGVELSRTLAIFVGPADRYDQFTRSAREQLVLGPRDGEFVGAILDPDGPGRRRQLRLGAEHAGAQLALGPAVALEEAGVSLARARALRELMGAGLIPAGALVQAEHHDVALLLCAERQLARELTRRLLAPLESVGGERTRANLASTLYEWLRNPGQRKTIAHALGVHPQTVRYRMARLRELFGAALDDADRRFELELALRLRPYARLEAGAGPEPAQPR